MSSRRRISVGGKIWYYRIGKSWCVAKEQDSGAGRRINLSNLTGMEWSDIERGQWKRWFHVTPKQIADWLINQ